MIKIKNCKRVLIGGIAAYSNNVNINISKCNNVTIVDHDEEFNDNQEDKNEYSISSIDEACFTGYNYGDEYENEDIEDILLGSITQILECEYPHVDHGAIASITECMVDAANYPPIFDQVCEESKLNPDRYDSPLENVSEDLVGLLSSLIHMKRINETVRLDHILKSVRGALDNIGNVKIISG